MMILNRLKILLFLSSLSNTNLSATAAEQCSGLKASYKGTENIDFTRPGKPDRRLHVYTPKNYDNTEPSKVVIFFHGWSLNGKMYTTKKMFQKAANKHNYVIIAPNGLRGDPKSKTNRFRSWTFKGSSDGIGSDGTVTTCNESAVINKKRNDYCDASCPCFNNPNASKCGWTHCVDDDVAFIRDFVAGGDGFANAMSDLVCHDPDAVFAMGESNGGMFSWELGQNPVSAKLLSGIAPIIGLPMCDYDLPQADGADVPVIVMTGDKDKTVSAFNLPYPGNPNDTCITNRDKEEFNFISSHRITTTWAKDSLGCTVSPNQFPQDSYDVPTVNQKKFKCRTWCKSEGEKAHSVDCTMVGMGHHLGSDAYNAALYFFDSQLGDICSKKMQNECSKATKCYWLGTCKDIPSDLLCKKYRQSRKRCEKAGCVWHGRKKCNDF